VQAKREAGPIIRMATMISRKSVIMGTLLATSLTGIKRPKEQRRNKTASLPPNTFTMALPDDGSPVRPTVSMSESNSNGLGENIDFENRSSVHNQTNEKSKRYVADTPTMNWSREPRSLTMLESFAGPCNRLYSPNRLVSILSVAFQV